MPIAFVFMLIFLVAAASGILMLVSSKKEDTKATGALLAGAGAVLGLVFYFIASFSTVSTQAIGIETSFGRPDGYLANGPHWHAPWKLVTEMDGAWQLNNFKGKNCSTVKIAAQQSACANGSIKWRINPAAAESLFKNYHSFSGVQDSLVTRELEVSLNQQFATYNPITSLTSSTPEGKAGNPTTSQIAALVTKQMRGDLNGQIQVDNVLVPNLTYDPGIQARINSVLAQVAATDVAQQSIKTAQAQAQANKDLANSISNNPNVLIQNCLSLEQDAVKTNYVFQAGFNCSLFAGSSVGVITGK